MNRNTLHQHLITRIQALDNHPNKDIFLTDVQKLCNLDSNQSLPGITASVWIDKLSELSDDKLYDYMTKYRKDMLNPWNN